MNLIPAFILERLAHRPGLIRIADNIGWLTLEKGLRMAVGLFVGIWVARYLGPQQYGFLNFALAFTGLFGVIAALGLEGIVVRDIVRNPDDTPLTLGTAAVLHLLAGALTYGLILMVIARLRPDDALSRQLVAILGLMVLLKFGQIASYWFQARVLSKYTVWVQSSAFLLFAGVKVLLIIREAPLVAFAWAILAEAALVAIALLIVLGLRGPALGRLRLGVGRAVTLLRDSWPLILSGMAVMVYMKIDQVMLGQMLGGEAVGVYSAAVSMSEVWYFLPMVVVSSVFPAILEARQRDAGLYHSRLQQLYDVMVLLSVAVALPMTFIATPLVVLLFGAPYAESGAVLAIHIWASVFVFLGVAGGKWFLAENLQLLSLQRAVLGAIANIGLNLWLIPLYGTIGAAVATVISQALAAFVLDLFQARTRSMFLMKAAAMNPLRLRIPGSFKGGL